MDWFAGLKVLSLETRRGDEMAALIGKYGGQASVVPSLRESPQDVGARVAEFAARLAQAPEQTVLAGLTGVGTRLFLQALAAHDPHALTLLKRARLIARGSKPALAMKAFGLVAETVPRPHTWHEVQDRLLEGELRGVQVTLLEYGEALPTSLVVRLAQAGAEVYPVMVYRCQLPEDPAPLQRAIVELIRGEHQVLLLSSGRQALHLLICARELGLEQELRGALARVVVTSIGPACSELLGELRLTFDLEANPHKMGILVRVAAEHAGGLLEDKVARLASASD